MVAPATKGGASFPPPRQRPQPLARALAQGHMPLCRAAAGPFGNTDQPTSSLNVSYHTGVPSFSKGATPRPLPPERQRRNPWHRGAKPRRYHKPLCAEGAGSYGNIAAPPTGIYCHWQYLLSVPRSFADAQDDSGRRSPDPRSRSSIPAAPRLHAHHLPPQAATSPLAH